MTLKASDFEDPDISVLDVIDLVATVSQSDDPVYRQIDAIAVLSVAASKGKITMIGCFGGNDNSYSDPQEIPKADWLKPHRGVRYFDVWTDDDRKVAATLKTKKGTWYGLRVYRDEVEAVFGINRPRTGKRKKKATSAEVEAKLKNRINSVRAVAKRHFKDGKPKGRGFEWMAKELIRIHGENGKLHGYKWGPVRQILRGDYSPMATRGIKPPFADKPGNVTR